MSLALLAVDNLQIGKSVCYISNNTYSVSFDGAKDAAYTAKYGQPPEMNEGRGRGKEREGRKGTEGTRIKEGDGRDGGRFAARGEGEREGKIRRTGELTFTPEP